MASSKKAHLLYKVNKKKVTNDKKIQQAYKNYMQLLERLKKEGPTKWMVNAIKTARARLVKYSFNLPKVDKELGFDFGSLTAKKTAKKKPAAKATTTEKKEATKKEESTEEKKAPAKKPAAEKKEKAVAPKKTPAKKTTTTEKKKPAATKKAE